MLLLRASNRAHEERLDSAENGKGDGPLFCRVVPLAAGGLTEMLR
jgi:hypothetical protein